MTPPPATAVRQPLVLATRNPSKLAELCRLLAPYPVDLVSLDEAGFAGELEEPADDYAANALAKAVPVAARTGLAALADDSGIEVEALGRWPGPASARWLGPDADDGDRLQGLIEEVDRRSPHDRRVRYFAAVALVRPGGEPVVALGGCRGRLVEPRGDRGFGYDPAFWSDELGLRFAEASDAGKDSVSHRARAITQLAGSGALGELALGQVADAAS